MNIEEFRNNLSTYLASIYDEKYMFVPFEDNKIRVYLKSSLWTGYIYIIKIEQSVWDKIYRINIYSNYFSPLTDPYYFIEDNQNPPDFIVQ